MVYPCQVQGDIAANTIVDAIHVANQRNECDTLILARGGGSLEDLWSFNEAMVAQAIFDSQIPIITGIGHETDTTIADWVADARAATPSQAAEMATPPKGALTDQLSTLQDKLLQQIITRLSHQQLALQNLKQRLRHPSQQCQHHMQQLDETLLRLQRAITQQHLQHAQQLATLAHRLHAHSPLATLARGYAVITHNDQTITDSRQVTAGDTLTMTLAKGTITGCVTATNDDNL